MTNTEIEFKLAGDLSDLEALETARLLAEAGAPKRTSLVSTYFDTPERKLQAAGVALRVRQSGDGARTQTVKTRGDGLVSRGEWEMSLNQAEPDLASLKGTPAAVLLSSDDVLDALFTVSVKRASWTVAHGRSRVEVSIDRGRIFKSEDPAASLPVAEAEFELLSGDVEDLAALLGAAMQAAPLKLGVASKSARGFALIEGRVNDVAHAAPVSLTADASAGEAFCAIANACLVQIRLNEDVMLARRDSEALHQSRVAIRRLRSAFSLFSPLVAHPRTEELKAELKRLSAPLGRARDLDVFLAETLAQERARRPDETGILNLEKQLQADKAKAYDHAVEALRSNDWRALIVELAAWVNAGAWARPDDEALGARIDGPARRFAAKVLEKRFRQVRRKSRKIAKISPEKRHEARIAAKKLRYGSEFFATLFDRGAKRAQRRVSFLKALKKLQGRLGDLNDVATGHELMADAAEAGRSRSAAFAAGVTAADVDARVAPLLAEAKAARKALMGAKPFW